MIFTIGFFYKNRQAIEFLTNQNGSLPIPVARKTCSLQSKIDLEDFELQSGPSTSTNNDDEYPVDLAHQQPHLIIQSELNDLLRYLELSKSESQPLGSRLRQWNLLEKGEKISSYRTR